MRFSKMFGIFTFNWLSEHLRSIFTLSTICFCSKWLINYQSICLSVFSVVSVSCWQNVEQFEVTDRAQEEFACDGASSFHFLCDATCLSSNSKILARIISLLIQNPDSNLSFQLYYVSWWTATPYKYFNNQNQLTGPTAKLNTYSMPRFLPVIKSEHRMWRLCEPAATRCGTQRRAEHLWTIRGEQSEQALILPITLE